MNRSPVRASAPALILASVLAVQGAAAAAAPFPPIQPENSSLCGAGPGSTLGTGTTNYGGTGYVKDLQNGESIACPNVNFGTGRGHLMVRLATPRDGGTIELRIDSASGPILATLNIPNTHGWAQRPNMEYSHGWRTASSSFSSVSGTHTVYLTFRHSAGGEVAQIDWLRFMNLPSSQTYYVSPTGSNSNNGTSLSTPFQTIDHAMNQVLPGDTIYLRGGTYSEFVSIEAESSGTAAHRVTILPYGNETPILDGTGLTYPNSNQALLLNRADYVTFSGLTVRNSAGRGITSDGDFVHFEGLKIHAIEKNGMNLREQTGSEIRNCEISDTSRMNSTYTANSGWANAIIVFDAHDMVIDGNLIHDNHGEGIIAAAGTYGFQISANVLYDNYGVNIYLSNSHNATVENNLVWESETAYISTSSSNWRKIAHAITITDENDGTVSERAEYGCDDSSFEPGGGHLIQNNILINTRRGINFHQYLPTMWCSGIKNTTVINNTIVNQWEEAVRLGDTDGWDDHVNSVFRNNIFHRRADSSNPGRVLTVFGKGTSLTFENNLFHEPGSASTDQFVWSATNNQNDKYSLATWNGQSGVANNLWQDPALVALGSLSGPSISASHKLTATSPARNAGSATGAPSYDYWWLSRPQEGVDDIGAHEYVP